MLSKKEIVKASKHLFESLKTEYDFSEHKVVTNGNSIAIYYKQVTSFGYVQLAIPTKKGSDSEGNLQNYIGLPACYISYNDIYKTLHEIFPERTDIKQGATIRKNAEKEGVCLEYEKGKGVNENFYMIYTEEDLEKFFNSFVNIYKNQFVSWVKEFSTISRASEHLDYLESQDVDPYGDFCYQSFNNQIILYYMISMIGGGEYYLNLIQRRYPQYFETKKNDSSVNQEELQVKIDEYNAIYPKIDAYFKSIGKFVEAKDPEV